MPRKSEPTLELKQIIWDLAATIGTGNMQAISRQLDIELEKSRKEGNFFENIPDVRKIKSIIEKDINELPAEVVIAKLPPHVWKLRNDYRAIKQLADGEQVHPDIDWTGCIAKARQSHEIPFYIPQKVRINKQSIDVREALQNESCLFVVGPAGAGKTTGLRNVYANLLDEIPKRLPVWVQLDIYEPTTGLCRLVERGIKQYGIQITQTELKKVLQTTAFVLIMDGWTEVLPDYRNHLRKEFRSWRSEYPNHRYLISGRRNEIYTDSSDAEPGFTGMTIAELQPFNEADLRQFLFKVLGYDIDLEKLPLQLKEVTQCPLYAKMLAELWKDKGEVDVGCVAELVEQVLMRELYRGAGTLSDSLRDELDEFVTELGADMHRRLVVASTRSQARDLIRDMWSRFRQSGRIVTSEESAVQAVLESPLIISERNAVRFAHQIFQEFFAGRWLANRFKAEAEKYTLLVFDPWWAYPVVFSVARAPDSGILQAIFQCRNLWAISRCLAGDAGNLPRDYCRSAIISSLEEGEEERRFAVRCLAETVDDAWVFEQLLNVISQEDRSRQSKETLFDAQDTVLIEALRPFMMCDHRLTHLPLQLLSKAEGCSRAAKFAVAQVLDLIATLGVYREENRELLVDLLLKGSQDSSGIVRSAAIAGLGNFAYHEKYSGSGEVPQTVIEALNKARSSNAWPEYQTALEALIRIGAIEIDEEWIKGEAKYNIDLAEAILRKENTELGASLGASLASNYFDEIVGEAIREAVDALGNEKFEKLLLLALPEANSMGKEDIIWHLSRMGSDTSIPALVKEVVSRPTEENAWEHRMRLGAANALMCIGTKTSIETTLSLTHHDLWDVRLLGIMVLLRSPTPSPDLKGEDYNRKIAQCWLEAKDKMLELMHHVGGGLMYRKNVQPAHSDDLSIEPVIKTIISHLPKAELILAARSILTKEVATELACHILGDFGTVEDLPYLHSILNKPNTHDAAKSAMERIHRRIK